MNHPAELALHKYLRSSIEGKSTMSQDIIDKIKDDEEISIDLSSRYGAGPTLATRRPSTSLSRSGLRSMKAT